MKSKFIKSAFLAAVLLLASCSSIKRHEIDTSKTLDDALVEATEWQDKALSSNADLLAYEDYKDGMEHLNEAREDMQEGDDRKEVMDDISYSIAYFERAINKANELANNNTTLLTARQAAVDAKVKRYSKLNKELLDIDEDLRDETDGFTKALSASELSMFQNKYLALEARSVEAQKLGWAQEIFNKRRDDNSEKLAPKLHKKTLEDIYTASNLINRSPRDAAVYSKSVEEANQSAWMLDEVMDVIVKSDGKTPEAVATSYVMKDRMLKSQDEKLSSYDSQVKAYKSSVNALGTKLDRQSTELMNTQSKVSFQKTMDEIRSSFSKEEAEVYQQGDKLIVRLKDLNFLVGGAAIPETSKPLVERIGNIVQKVEVTALTVQGHTDATGPKALNEKLSKERAKNVASYLKESGLSVPMESVGFGPSRPLANNETEEERKLNRRVDIVIETKAPEGFYSE